MIVHNDIKQGTKEWQDIRKLKFTASHASTILARGRGVQTLIKQMLADYYSSGNYGEYSDKYKNSNMQRGNDYEAKARAVYELETGNKVQQVGFIETDEFEGCSPDGLVNEDGLLEIKNPNDNRFLQLILDEKIDKEYLDQMQMQMYVSKRAWCDFFAFNPNFNPCYYTKRIHADLGTQVALAQALQEAKEKLKSQKDILDKKLTAKRSATHVDIFAE